MHSTFYSIGLFGGTFNPMHTGHIHLVRNAKKIACLDIVYCIPTFIAPHKHTASIPPFDERCMIIQEKLRQEKSILLSTIEAELPTPSYTYRTLHYFAHTFPYAQYYFISGSVDFCTIHTWDNGMDILLYTNHIIAPRNTVTQYHIYEYIQQYIPINNTEETEEAIYIYTQHATYIYMKIPNIPISSTEVRAI